MLICRSARAQFSCSGQGWSDNQCADPFHLFYLPSDSTGMGFFDGNGMFTDDPSNLQWNAGGLFQVRIRNPGVGNVFGAFHVLTNTGSPGAVFAINSGGWTAPNEDSLGVEIVNASGQSIQIYGGTNNAIGTAYMEGQTAAAGGFPSTAFGAQLFTTATHGFLYIPTTFGLPTGVPAGLPWQYAGTVPIVYNTLSGTLYCYHGGWAPCDPAGSGTVTTVTGTPPIFITSTPTTTPNVTIQGAIVSGSTSTTAQNLGAISTSLLACSTAAGVCTVDGVTVTGGVKFDTGTATETLDAFTCAANKFVSSSSTSGLACTQPAYSDISGTPTLFYQTVETGTTPLTQEPNLSFASTQFVVTDLGGTSRTLVTMATPTTDLSGAWPGSNVVAIEDAASMKGSLVATEIATPSAPSAGNIKIYGNTTADNAMMERSNGNVTHMMQTAACGADTFFTGSADDGTFTCTAPVSYPRLVMSYYLNGIAAATLFTGGWVQFGTTVTLSSLHIESPVPFAAAAIRIMGNVLSNSISAGATTINMTRNGANPSAGGSITVGAGATGAFDSGYQAGITSAAGDDWGLVANDSSALATGTLTAVVTFYVY